MAFVNVSAGILDGAANLIMIKEKMATIKKIIAGANISNYCDKSRDNACSDCDITKTN